MSKLINDMSAEEVLKLPTLGLDDTFTFSCKACGKCCKNRVDILLTPYDLFNIAQCLKHQPIEIIDRYCDILKGQKSLMPIVHVRPVPPDNSCPFLRNKKCIVHAKKPVLCRVYPLARMSFMGASESRYYLNGSSCNHNDAVVTVRDWIGVCASDECEKAAQLWKDTLYETCILLDSLKDTTKTEEFKKCFIDILEILYTCYDIDKPFIPQYEANFKKLKALYL